MIIFCWKARHSMHMQTARNLQISWKELCWFFQPEIPWVRNDRESIEFLKNQKSKFIGAVLNNVDEQNLDL